MQQGYMKKKITGDESNRLLDELFLQGLQIMEMNNTFRDSFAQLAIK